MAEEYTGKCTTDGGKPIVKPLPYVKPVGPKGIDAPKTPGLHGTNHGKQGTQGKR